MSALSSLRRHVPLLATSFIFLVLFITASCLYDGFFSSRVAISLLSDNAFLGIAAVGMTLVIFTGGIDLSVGAVIGFTSIFTAKLIAQQGWNPVTAWIAALVVGTALGALMGTLIHTFRLPPFLITLAGMFLARGSGFWISTDTIGIQHPWYDQLANYEWGIGSVHVPSAALILLAVIGLGYVLAHHTRFGRNLFAIGGSESSALLMGLPVGRVKIGVYALNGFCAAFAGIVTTLFIGSGDPNRGLGLELDAIAIVAIGGTLLRGGRGHMLGTLVGILIFGTIQAALLFDGRLDSAWLRIVVGALLLAFILLQRVLLRSVKR